MAVWNFLTPPNKENKPEQREMLRALQDSIESGLPSTSPKPRKRSHQEEHDAHTPTKKRVVVITNGMNSPDSTPIKQSSQISLISNIETASKKLNLASSLPTPETTPAKQTRVVDILKEPSSEGIFPARTPTAPQGDEDKENLTPTKSGTLYTKGKLAFLRSATTPFTTHLPERKTEAEALKSFLVHHITARQGTSLYISGPPGTGKTAQTVLTLSEFVDTQRPHGGVQHVDVNGRDFKVGYAYINCMALGKAETVFSELYKALSGGKTHIKESKEVLYKFLTSANADMSVVVLDELDQLLQARTDEVFSLFSWAVSCKIVLIGISNSLDMVDRLLPRLKMNGLSPNTLNFLPYSAEQIANIIKAKLKLLIDDNNDSKIPLFHPAAIQLCARKAASHTGDLRKAFDLCRAAVEATERDWKKTANNLDSSDLPLVKIQHIARIANNAFNSSPISKLRTLNLSQKYLLCMLLRAEASISKISPSGALSVNGFYEYYIKQISKDTQIVGVLKKPEFLEVLSSLEANSFVRIYKTKKALSDAKISCSVIKENLIEVIKGVYVLEKLMI